ncbi:MAG: MFS transporter [Spirochaetia bacterium]
MSFPTAIRRALRRPLSSYIERACGPLGLRRLSGLKWFWLDGVFSQAQESFSGDYIPLFALAAGASAGSIGLLAAAASLLSIAGFLPGAIVGSRLRARKPFVLASGGIAGRLFLPLLALSPLLVPSGAGLVFLIIALNALRILAGSFANASWTSLVADLVPSANRGRYFANRNMAIGVAALAASPLAGLIIGTINGRSVHAFPGYQVSLLAAFALGMVSTVSFSRIPEPPARKPARLREKARGFLDLVRRNPPFAWLAASSLVWGVSLTMASPFFNVYLITALGGNAAAVGTAAGVFALAGLFGQAAFGRLTDRRGSRAILVLTGFLIPIFPLLWALARAPLHVYLINVGSGFLWAGYNLASFNILLEMSPAEDRESAVGLYQSAVAASAVLGPLLGGYLAGAVGFKVVFALSGVGRLAGTSLFLAMARQRKKTRAA